MYRYFFFFFSFGVKSEQKSHPFLRIILVWLQILHLFSLLSGQQQKQREQQYSEHNKQKQPQN